MKKIILATGIYPPEMGGPATHVQTIGQALAKQNIAVSILAYGQGPSQDGPVAVNWVSRRWPKILRHFIFLRRLKRLAKGADRIVAFNAVSAGWPTKVVGKKLGVPFIVRIVGDAAWERAQQARKTNLSVSDFQETPKSGYIGQLDKIQRLVCQAATAVYVPSLFLKKIVSGWGVSEEKIEIIHNGFDISVIDLSKEEARLKVGISGNIILSVARLVPWKGMRMLIKIMPEILKDDPFARLVIIGEGPEEEKLKAMIKTLRLERSTVILPRKNREELATYFAAADMFVLNTFYEGFSHLLIEALALGTPVITTEAGGNPEIIEQGQNGLAVPFNDEAGLIEAIKMIHTNDDLRAKLIARGYNSVQKFSRERMIEEILKLFLKNL